MDKKWLNFISSSFVKIKFSDFSETTAEEKGYEVNLEKFEALLSKSKMRHNEKSIRLVGVGVKFKEKTQDKQGSLDVE